MRRKIVGVLHDAFGNVKEMWMDTSWERRSGDSDELVRELYKVAKPKIYAYDRYADACLRTYT